MGSKCKKAWGIKISCKVRSKAVGKSSGPEGLNSRSQSTNMSAVSVIERRQVTPLLNNIKEGQTHSSYLSAYEYYTQRNSVK